MAAEVYFLNDRATQESESLKWKAVKVFRDAGLGELFKPGDWVGIKIHFGEYGNTANLRPQLVRAIADEVKRKGGKPAVMDCTVLHTEHGSRSTATDTLRCAARHGFTEETMDCPIWVPDGEYGFDDVRVEIPHGVYMKHSYMGKRFTELGAMIAVTHFKGHPLGIVGGTMKNIGIGCGSRKGKLMTHGLNHPVYGLKKWIVTQEMVDFYGAEPEPNQLSRFVKCCAFDVYSYEKGVFNVDMEKCVQCGGCWPLAMSTALLTPPAELDPMFVTSIADACSAYVNAIGKERVGYINYAIDITPWCDCCNWSDRQMVPNMGVFASRDPVAIDTACLEMMDKSSAVPGSKAEELGYSEPGEGRFTHCAGLSGVSQWVQINSAIYNGLGTSEYTLIHSQLPEEEEFWFPPYTALKPFPIVHRDGLRKQNWNVESYSHDEMKMSISDLSIRPKGLVSEKDL